MVIAGNFGSSSLSIAGQTARQHQPPPPFLELKCHALKPASISRVFFRRRSSSLSRLWNALCVNIILADRSSSQASWPPSPRRLLVGLCTAALIFILAIAADVGIIAGSAPDAPATWYHQRWLPTSTAARSPAPRRPALLWAGNRTEAAGGPGVQAFPARKEVRRLTCLILWQRSARRCCLLACSGGLPDAVPQAASGLPALLRHHASTSSSGASAVWAGRFEDWGGSAPSTQQGGRGGLQRPKRAGRARCARSGSPRPPAFLSAAGAVRERWTPVGLRSVLEIRL